jgi:hypothetical protein
MHCPNCGNESSLDQKFCRKCGFALAPIGELMRDGEQSAEVAKLDKAEREALLVRQMFRWISWGIIVLGLGVLMLVVDKSFDVGKAFKFVCTLVMLAGIGIATYGVISTMMRSGAATLKATESKKDELRAPTTRELEGGVPISIPSVTERTTELIGRKADAPK